jgi:antitoxin component YwqK of YwqJK toxin-antitoxin module
LYQGYFKQDKAVGVWTEWHASGKRASEGAYRNGIPIGLWTWWNEAGEVIYQKTYQGDTMPERWDEKLSRWRPFTPYIPE